MAATESASVDLPVSMARAWDRLSDTTSMILIDPAIEAYEPEGARWPWGR